MYEKGKFAEKMSCIYACTCLAFTHLIKIAGVDKYVADNGKKIFNLSSLITNIYCDSTHEVKLHTTMYICIMVLFA